MSDAGTPSQPPAAPEPAEPPALPVTFRPVMTRVVLMTIGAVAFGMLTLIAFLLPAGGAVSWGPGDRLALAGSGLLVWGVLALLCRPKVAADRDGVTVVNLTTKRRLTWPEIVRVSLRSGDPWVTLDLADGSTLAVMGIQPSNGRGQAVAEARTLRTLVETYGTAAPSAG